MVLFKRKPVQYVSPPPLLDDQEIWPIEETDEIFTNYDAYLARMDFYKQKRFICEITGHSGLDFFDALRNEMEASSEVNDAFPDSLKEPILRKVQFSTISRIDNLVDHIFEEFKQDFYPGESVTVILDNGDRLNGIVREKTKFPELIQSDGTLERKAFARYFVSLTGRPEEEALVDEEHIARDRKTFTKQMLRSFLRNSVTRAAWTGAPWLVKNQLANDYRINIDIPLHLRYEHQVAQRKVNLNMKKGDYDGPTIVSFFSGQPRLPELKPKSHKSKYSQQGLPRSRQEQFLDYQRALAGSPGFAFDYGLQATNGAQFIQCNDYHPGYPAIAVRGIPKPPPAPPVKYPIEDLEIPPVQKSSHRPELKYLSLDAPTPHQPSGGTSDGILMSSVGPLLETWDTLNVYCEVFLLDSFTFDDYIEALQFTSEDVQCELLAEIHCAVLKKLVNDEKDLNGQVQVVLPVAVQEDSEEEESREHSKTPIPEPEIKPRTTRSSVAKSEAAELKVAAAVDAKLHRAAEIDQSIRGYDWRFRLRKRDFKHGRWIVIVVGLLNLLAVNPRLRMKCDEILVELAPLDMPPTEETAISQYASLDINRRVMILQILCMLSLETQAIRSYMEECTGLMTQFRKEKIDQQRTRKTLMERLRILHEERKALQPEDISPAPDLEELEELENSKMNEIEDEDEVVIETEDEEPIRGRSLRRANDRAMERKRKLEEERERKEKAEIERAKKPTKQARQLEKILKKIETTKEEIRTCEQEIITFDNDLRENDCPRTRVLGKDRFWNRYYWMERNAMPYGGLPDSSTADAGYANGRLWVQGPDELERQGFIDLAESENAQYRRAFNMSVPERKLIEEGPTHTFNAHQWGYYDEPDQLDKLIAWLDPRGNREVKLRKELQAQRVNISTHMEKRKEYLSHAGEKKPDFVEPVSRVSTRTKTYVDPTGHRCLAWRNSTAIDELGYIHSNPLPRKAQNVKNAKKAIVLEDEGRQTRASKQQKPLTRQGSRYDF